MFAYCRNNPISRKDALGTASFDVVLDGVDLPFDDWIDGETGGGYSVPGVSSSYFATQNVRAYDSWWQNSCYNPNMTWSNGAASSRANATIVPQYAWDTLNYVKSHNGSPPNGYKGGKLFVNDGRNGGGRLPDNYQPFYEYDVHPKVTGQNRGRERIVIGNGAAWYTSDHYNIFTRME